MSSKSSTTAKNSKKPPKSADKKKKEESPSPEEIPKEEPKAKDFKDLEFVEQCLKIEKPEELIKFLAQELLLQDYLVNMRSSIRIDYFVYSIVFCKDHSFTKEKASVFLNLMELLLQMTSEPNANLDQISEFFKKELMNLGTFQVKQVIDEPPKEEEPEKKTKAKTDKKSTKKNEDNQKQSEPPKMKEVVETPVFTVDDVHDITQFVVNGLLKHFRLYHYVFTQEQVRETHDYTMLLQNPAEPLPLSKAVDEATWNEQKEAERKRLEEEERLRKQKEEEERIRREKEEEERRLLAELEAKAPKLSSKDLEEIAQYLQYHFGKQLEESTKPLLERLNVVEQNVKPGTKKDSKSAGKKETKKK